MISNCIFEALKAKIRDPKAVKVFRLPKDLSDAQHWMWKKDDSYCHARQVSKEHWWNYALHAVKYRKVPNYTMDALMVTYTTNLPEAAKRRIARTIDSDFAKIGKGWCYSFAADENLPTVAEIAYFEKVLRLSAMFKVEQDSKVSIIDSKEFRKLTMDLGEDEMLHWKLIDFFDQDFEVVYDKCENVEWNVVN